MDMDATTKTYRCPQCAGEIPMADINVATDVALCRRCGKATPFSLLSGIPELDFAQLDAPMKGVTVTESMIGGTELVYRRFSNQVFFLVPFTAVWGGISLGLIYGSQIAKGKFDLGDSLFGLPFALGTLAMILWIVFLIFGKHRLRLDRGQGEFFSGVGPVGRTKRFTYGPETVVSLELIKFEVNGVKQRAISVRTGDDSVKFGALLRDDAKRYFAAWIARECSAR